MVRARALRANTCPPRPRPSPSEPGTQTLHLEKCSKAIQDFLSDGGAEGMRVGLELQTGLQKFIRVGVDA